MSKFKRGDTVLYNGSEPGIIIDINSGEGDIDYDVELNNGDIIKTFSNKLKLKTRLGDLKQKKENGTLSPDERREYLQLSLDNSNKQYTNKIAKIEDNSGGKRKTRKAKKRKTRKGKKGKKGKKVRKSRK
jgi:hypothetical protein